MTYKSERAPILEASTAAISTPGRAAILALAGDCTLTVRSEMSGRHFTFRINKPKDFKPERPIWFVGLLQGSNNEQDFHYLGLIRQWEEGTNTVTQYYHGSKSTTSPDSHANKAFEYFFTVAMNEKPAWPAGLTVWHAGRCAVCGRKLTRPESIESGIGPECEGKGGY